MQTIGNPVMKLKRNEIEGKFVALRRSLQKELPQKTAYWFGRLFNRMESEIKHIRHKQQTLIEKYAAKDAHGKPVLIDIILCAKCHYEMAKDAAECPRCKGTETTTDRKYDIPEIDKLNEEFEAYMQEEIQIEFKPIQLTPANFGEAKFTPEEMMMLQDFIEEPGDFIKLH
jgi:predicted Zn-ribbon and HTH transcriptional regulator